MDPIIEIEQFRAEKGLKPADMAREFGVAAQNYNNWVYRGSLPKAYYRKAGELIGKSLLPPPNVSSPNLITGKVPLISYAQASEWPEGNGIKEPGRCESYINTTVQHSSSAFALRVDGYSMTLPTGVDGPSFPPGMIIHIDPEAETKPGDFVLAKHPDGVTFKKLTTDEGRQVLLPLNPDRANYPIIRDNFQIIGRVFDASWGGL